MIFVSSEDERIGCGDQLKKALFNGLDDRSDRSRAECVTLSKDGNSRSLPFGSSLGFEIIVTQFVTNNHLYYLHSNQILL